MKKFFLILAFLALPCTAHAGDRIKSVEKTSTGYEFIVRFSANGEEADSYFSIPFTDLTSAAAVGEAKERVIALARTRKKEWVQNQTRRLDPPPEKMQNQTGSVDLR